MEMYELCPGLLVRDGRTLLKVSSVYPTYVTAQVARPLTAPRCAGTPPATSNCTSMRRRTV